MSLLREIQNDAVNTNVKVSDLLRKCKILAYRLGNEDFKIWIENELNGYSNVKEEELPAYRVLEKLNSKGHFAGPFNSGLRNADIPIFNLPKELQHSLSIVTLNRPIAELEDLSNNESELSQSWNPLIVAKYGMQMYQGYNCIQAWKIISSSALVGIIDTIKTKILNFVLEIEMLDKDAGDVEINSNPIPQDKISQIFNFNIAGDVQNLASGNHQSAINQTISNTIPQDFLELLTKLKCSDLDDKTATDVAKKIENLGVLVGTSEYKKAYTELMSFASNHVTVLGFLAPYIPMLTSYLT